MQLSHLPNDLLFHFYISFLLICSLNNWWRGGCRSRKSSETAANRDKHACLLSNQLLGRFHLNFKSSSSYHRHCRHMSATFFWLKLSSSIFAHILPFPCSSHLISTWPQTPFSVQQSIWCFKWNQQVFLHVIIAHIMKRRHTMKVMMNAAFYSTEKNFSTQKRDQPCSLLRVMPQQIVIIKRFFYLTWIKEEILQWNFWDDDDDDSAHEGEVFI